MRQIGPAVRGPTLEDLAPRGVSARCGSRGASWCPRRAGETRALGGDRPGGRLGAWRVSGPEKGYAGGVCDAGARAGDAEGGPFEGALESSNPRIAESLAEAVGPRSPARRVVVHGSRTSRATYAVGDETSAEPASKKRSFSNASPRVSGEAFAKRASAAFRAALGRLVIAEVDAWMDREGMASVDAWARAERASLATFAARAATLAAEDTAADAARTAAAPSVFPMTTRARNARKRRRAPSGDAPVCSGATRWMSRRSSST